MLQLEMLVTWPINPDLVCDVNLETAGSGISATKALVRPLLPLAVSTKASRRRLLHFESRRIINSHNSAKAALGLRHLNDRFLAA